MVHRHHSNVPVIESSSLIRWKFDNGINSYFVTRRLKINCLILRQTPKKSAAANYQFFTHLPSLLFKFNDCHNCVAVPGCMTDRSNWLASTGSMRIIKSPSIFLPFYRAAACGAGYFLSDLFECNEPPDVCTNDPCGSQFSASIIRTGCERIISSLNH